MGYLNGCVVRRFSEKKMVGGFPLDESRRLRKDFDFIKTRIRKWIPADFCHGTFIDKFRRDFRLCHAEPIISFEKEKGADHEERDDKQQDKKMQKAREKIFESIHIVEHRHVSFIFMCMICICSI